MDRSIDNLIARLRKKIEHDPDHPSLIKTVRGIGYILAADVKRGAAPKG
jgi:DNA-binding response OmpR family regulator